MSPDVLRCFRRPRRRAFAPSSERNRATPHQSRVKYYRPERLRATLLLYDYIWAIDVRIRTSTNALYGVRPMAIRGLVRWHTLHTPRAGLGTSVSHKVNILLLIDIHFRNFCFRKGRRARFATNVLPPGFLVAHA